MKEPLKYLFLIIVFQLLSLLSFAQTPNDSTTKFKHNIAIQFNPAYSNLEELIWHGSDTQMKAYALRYGYKVHPNITIGPEFSGFKLKTTQNNVLVHENNSLNFGVFSRYTLNKFRIVKPFAEASFYYTYNQAWFIQEAERVDVNSDYIGGYFAPGLSFCFLKNRINLDVMYKFSPRYFVNSKKSVISWRLCYNFNL